MLSSGKTETIRVSVQGIETPIMAQWVKAAKDVREQVVFCTHGAFRATNERKFNALSQAMSQHGVDTLLIDQEGHGRSEGDPRNLSVDRWSKVMEAALDQLTNNQNRTPIGIFAHSLGGLAALQYKDRLVCDIPIVMMASPLQKGKLMRLWSIQKAFETEKQKEGWSEDKIQDELVAHLDEHLAKASELTNEELIASFPTKMKPYIEVSAQADYTAMARNHQKELLGVYGERDAVSSARLVSEEIFEPNQLIVVPGGDHDMDKTDAHLAAWLNPSVNFLSNN